MENLVQVVNEQVVVSSRQVAEHFGKEHTKVVRSIKELLGIAKIGDTPLFFENEYIHPQNKQQYTEYLMNRDGFTLLVMGFNGKQALEWKLKYIEAFNEMERQLRERPLLPDFTNPVIAARAWAEQVEARQLAEQKVSELAPKASIADAFIEKGHSISFRDLAKELGVKESSLRWFLMKNKIAYRQGGRWKPYAASVAMGWMVSKDTMKQPNGYVGVEARYTMEGKDGIRKLLAKNNQQTAV